MNAEAEKTYVQHLLAEIKAEIVSEVTAALDTRPLLTTPQAAERLGVSARTVRNILERGELDTVVVGEKSRRITPASLDAYIARRRESGYGTRPPED